MNKLMCRLFGHDWNLSHSLPMAGVPRWKRACWRCSAYECGDIWHPTTCRRIAINRRAIGWYDVPLVAEKLPSLALLKFANAAKAPTRIRVSV